MPDPRSIASFPEDRVRVPPESSILTRRQTFHPLRSHLPQSRFSPRSTAVTGILENKFGIVFGVANKRSIAWAIAQAWHKAGAKLAFTYQGERLKDNVEELAGTFGADTLLMA